LRSIAAILPFEAECWQPKIPTATTTMLAHVNIRAIPVSVWIDVCEVLRSGSLPCSLSATAQRRKYRTIDEGILPKLADAWENFDAALHLCAPVNNRNNTLWHTNTSCRR
jgi:hypothetical protein